MKQYCTWEPVIKERVPFSYTESKPVYITACAEVAADHDVASAGRFAVHLDRTVVARPVAGRCGISHQHHRRRGTGMVISLRGKVFP